MDTFATNDRKEWRAYLEAHFETAEEVWFVFPVKAAEEESLSYNDAVEEALCFGWIDSTNRHLDDLHCIRRFTPRKKGSAYSQPNIERLCWLNERGMIHPAVRESVLPVIQAPFEFPQDILEALQQDKTVWENYQAFSESYKRIRVAYIEAARKRPAEFKKRLQSFIDKTRRGKLIKGYGGIDKYYY
ncbi:MAG: YdeI/OmpD-associated family protein [Clostridiales bacterium]|nr:YdeI/OmpD-associated family protein [Clostridiales bacterium]